VSMASRQQVGGRHLGGGVAGMEAGGKASHRRKTKSASNFSVS
jgi:hypothetical protein